MNQAQILLRARDYLVQLDRYIDPLTGKYLPQETVFRDEDVHKHIFFACLHLERIIVYDCDWNRLPFAPDPNRRGTVKVECRAFGIKRMAELITQTCDITRTRSVQIKQLREYLFDRGYLQKSAEGKDIPTPKGTAAGLSAVKGDRDDFLLFEPTAQQLLLNSLDDLAEYYKTNTPEKAKKERVNIDADSALYRGLQNQLQVTRALSQGRHPVTGQSLPASDPACQQRLKACFGYVARALEQALELGYYSAKRPFALTRAEWEAIPVSEEPCALNTFVERANARIQDRTATQTMTAPKMRELLTAAGVFTMSPGLAGRPRFAVTAKGEALGIYTQNTVGNDGKSFEILVYSKAAQQYMITLLEPVR